MDSDRAKITKNKKGFSTNFLIGDSLFFEEKGIVYRFETESIHVNGDKTFSIYNGHMLRPVEMLFVSEEGAQRAAYERRKQDLLDQIDRHKTSIDKINEKLSNGNF